jgi:hypothetical protein
MTDLERKLAETLREQAGEVTPHLDGAWAEHQRRMQRPAKSRRRNRMTVVIAPLAAVLVVLTSVLLATQLNTASAPARPASPGQPLSLAKPEYFPPMTLGGMSEPIPLIDFAGQTDTWTSYAASTSQATGRLLFCVEALPKGGRAPTQGESESQFGIKSPSCVPFSTAAVIAGYVGETGGPLPAGKAVYLVEAAVRELRLYDAQGDLSQAKQVGLLGQQRLFLADVKPESPPTRFEVNSTEARPASR